MKRTLLISLLFCTSLFSSVFSQNETAIVIGDREITLGEFERLYKKNSAAITLEQQDLDEYLERFVNFKLKVIEAENLGNDTTESFLKELNGYRKELAKPYMMDSAFVEQLLMNAYNKIKKEVNASHILITLQENALPADTLAAWEKIMNIRSLALQGEDFGKLAEQHSDDPSAVQNKGLLGWFTAFRMVPEFEETAFATPPGNISMPVRTRFGYHIIKVNENRTARGSVHVAHIYLALQQEASEEEAAAAKETIFDIHKKLQAGEDFAELVSIHSDDRASANDGGKLQWFTSGVMIPEFENAAFALDKPGQFSEPVKSFFGWHIIQLIEKKSVGTFQEERAELLNKINSDNYSAEKRKAYIEKLKKEHNFTFNEKNFEGFHNYIDTSFFTKNWSSSSIPNPNRVLISIGDKKITLGDFGKYLEDFQQSMPMENLPSFINERFQKFTDDEVYNYEESLLAGKHPDFNYILQEYHDGILLFDLTDKMVWSKAVNDTTGLEKFFKKNRKSYKWDTRAEVYIVKVNDTTLVPLARELTARLGKKHTLTQEMMLNELCPEDTLGSCVELTYGKFEKGANAMVDEVDWKKGLKDNSVTDEQVSFIYVKKILKPGPKELDETRGMVISDYQEHLEKQWINELRAKYPVTINKDVVARIK